MKERTIIWLLQRLGARCGAYGGEMYDKTKAQELSNNGLPITRWCLKPFGHTDSCAFDDAEWLYWLWFGEGDRKAAGYLNGTAGEMVHNLAFCGCGDPDSVAELVRDLLAVFEPRHNKDGSDWSDPWPKLESVLGTKNEATVFLVLYWLSAVGLTEHGGAVGGDWLTEDGSRLLRLLRVICDLEEIDKVRSGIGPDGLAQKTELPNV